MWIPWTHGTLSVSYTHLDVYKRQRYENAPLCTLPAKLSVSGLVHEGAAPVLARPAFLYKEGLTAAAVSYTHLQLGIEALSRGAARCVFIDSSREACAVVRQNLKAAGLFEKRCV